METSVTYMDETAHLSSDEKKVISKIRKLMQTYPSEITILAEPENNDGCLYCLIPSKWVKIQPPKRMDLSDQERAERANRMRKQIHTR